MSSKDNSFASYPTRRAILAGGLCAAPMLVLPRVAPVQAQSWFDSLFGQATTTIRRLHMYSLRSTESINIVYWLNGNYIPEALDEVNTFMRDVRANATHPIAPRVIDILAATHRLLDTDEPFALISGYRTAATNAYLRQRSRGVARNSLHMIGQAADISLKTRSVGQIAQAAQSCVAGGVGRYDASRFVHVDCGALRTWRG